MVDVLRERPEGPTSCPTCGSTTKTFFLFEPAGFRSDYTPVDYDDRVEQRGYVGPPQLAFQRGGEWREFGRLRVAALAGADVLTINDNGGNFFSLYRYDDSYVAADPALYERDVSLPVHLFEGRAPDRTGAIGYVKRTDVLVLSPTELDVPGPVAGIVPARCPAGLAAFWSFGEVVRRAATLDRLAVDPSEMQLGIQAVVTPDGTATTRQVFLADTLENGAGYASHLAQDGETEMILKSASSLNWVDDPRHAERCTSSCPTCLRSYDNRFLHPLLDWRLALDMLELVQGDPLSVGRWLALGEPISRWFADAFGVEGDMEALELPRGLWGVRSVADGRGVLFGHPLWSTEEQWFTEEQAAAWDGLRSLAPATKCFDLFTLRRKPHVVFSWLVAADHS